MTVCCINGKSTYLDRFLSSEKASLKKPSVSVLMPTVHSSTLGLKTLFFYCFQLLHMLKPLNLVELHWWFFRMQTAKYVNTDVEDSPPSNKRNDRWAKVGGVYVWSCRTVPHCCWAFMMIHRDDFSSQAFNVRVAAAGIVAACCSAPWWGLWRWLSSRAFGPSTCASAHKPVGEETWNGCSNPKKSC